MRRFIAVSAVLCSLAVQAQTFHPEAIKARMSFLASDLLEGRETGSRGYAVASEYVASEFEAAGLEPGGNGSWFQAVPFQQTQVVDAQLTLNVPGSAPEVLQFGEGFLLSGNPLQTVSDLSGGLVFAGFGISAPEARYDDYAKLEAKGKIVVLMNGAPEAFSTTLRAHYSSSLTKLETAMAHGATGIITLRTPEQYKRDVWERNIGWAKEGAMNWLRPDGTPKNVFPELPVSFYTDRTVAEKLFVKSGQTYEQAVTRLRAGKARRGPLRTTVALHVKSKHTPVESRNVVGVVRGSDPRLSNEYVVVTAHLDHLGIGEPVNGDSINNGAFDNASGVSIVLDAAREVAAARPRRSVLFVATTGEEKGLRGADYFASNPTVPVASIVANINIDQVYLFAPSRDITVIGAENSELGASAARVAATMGIELSPDPFPEEVVFVRSDQYPFVRQGIPAVFPIAGSRAVDPAIDLRKMQSEWERERYHQPSDDMNQPIDYRPAVQMAEFTYRMVLDVANTTAKPKWNAGDFFGEKFGRR